MANYPNLKKVKPDSGWLMDKWRKDSVPKFKPAPFNQFVGDRIQLPWVFDEKTANATEVFYAQARGKKNNILVLNKMEK
ncbi:hypothetical protein [Flavobacterium commune]|uniref:hypothetical protein n=1 Tax=Flavobacterium commune TaxID=1306519 RepID=UPI0018DD5372|nr:hypothetical protein [Flavobacterium commune]